MTPQALARRIAEESAGRKRFLVAIAGPPASGKSRLATKLKAEINAAKGSRLCEIVPMDGFHLDNSVLDSLQLRNRKGAPETFDIDGFIGLVRRIRKGKETVNVPVFDRVADAVVENGLSLAPDTPIVLIEGNYLLLDRPPWNALSGLFDLTVMKEPAMDELERRLIRRWLKHGLNPDAARHRALSNDIPNARLVLKQSAAADIRLQY